MSLRELCEKVKADGEKATPRPWCRTGVSEAQVEIASYSVPIGERHVCSGEGLQYNPWHLGNLDYIVTAANSADRISRAAIVLLDACKESHRLLQINVEYNRGTVSALLGEAIQTAEKIAAGGE